jgi:hypothetical protein
MHSDHARRWRPFYAPTVISAGNPVSREHSIGILRDALTRFADADKSICKVAAERGIFCRGFQRWPVAEFDRRWRKSIGRSSHLSREQMERFADLWQMTEQFRCGVALACDANCGPDSPCRGWDEFSDEDLARFCRDLQGPARTKEGTS